ncbi:MAG: hypothetical protein WD557_08515 [Dehalococcoidia bacterium]
MTNHPGDTYSFLQLARLREEQLERKSKHRALVQQAPYRPGLRAAIAGVLRSTADRVETPRTAETPARRYQRVP